MSKNCTNGQDYVIEERYDVKEICQADISLAPRTVTGTNTKQPITVTAGVFDAGNNEIKFPSKGYYMIHLETQADIDEVTGNWLEMQLYNSFTASFIENKRYHRVGGYNIHPYGHGTFFHWCNDTRDRIQIFMKSEKSNISISNVTLKPNSRVVRLLDYGV